MTATNNVITHYIHWRNADVYSPTDMDLGILYCTSNSKIGVLKNTFTYEGGDINKKHSHWDFLKKKYNITWWVYQIDIIPD